MSITMSKIKESYLEHAISTLGGCEATGRICGLTSGKAVQRWLLNGRLPRTEATGETRYAEQIIRACRARGIVISKTRLLSTVYRRSLAA